MTNMAQIHLHGCIEDVFIFQALVLKFGCALGEGS